jgi:ParB family transcriptional regulator, chromosome partitioning protein
MSKLLSKSRSISVVMPGFIEDIDISQIKESQNIFRRSEANLQELCSSIQQKGLLQPVLVRTLENHYEIVAGRRRFRACKSLGWKKVACHVIELDDKNAFEISLVENMHRKTLSPIEEADAFKAYISDFGWGGVSDLATKIGKSKSYVTKRIKLLNLPSDVLHSIITRKIAVSIAEELFQVKDQNKQSLLANLISNRRLSMRNTRKFIKEQDESDITFQSNHKNEYIDHVRLAERSFDKSIAAIRVAMNSLGEVINSIEHDWIVYEVLMQHKNMLHTQIDILLKEKGKLQL